MTAQATCPGAGADAHLCVGRHAELPDSERCQVKNTSVFKDKIPGSPWKSVHSISWGSGAGVTPPALFRGSGFLPPLFNESCSQTPNQPLRAGVGGPLPLASWGSVFLGREASRRVPRPARAERHVGRLPGRWRSGQWQLVPAVGKPFPPGPGGQGAAGPRGRGGPASSTGTVRGARLGCCLFRVSPSHAEASPGLAGAFGRGPWGQARRVTMLPPRARAPASLLLDLPPSSSGT